MVQGPNNLFRAAVLANVFESCKNVDIEIEHLGENLGPVEPRLRSIKKLKAMRPRPCWWAKLDDDGEVPPGCWDALVDAIIADNESSFDFSEPGYAMASPNGQAAPRILRQYPAATIIENGNFGELSGPLFHGWRCSFVGDGATLFSTEVFDNMAYDAKFLRGADVDLAVQAALYGYHCILCDTPRSVHRHKDCSPEDYDRVRYDAQLVWDAAEAFRDKWGKDCPHLSQFGVRG